MTDALHRLISLVPSFALTNCLDAQKFEASYQESLKGLPRDPANIPDAFMTGTSSEHKEHFMARCRRRDMRQVLENTMVNETLGPTRRLQLINDVLDNYDAPRSQLLVSTSSYTLKPLLLISS